MSKCLWVRVQLKTSQTLPQQNISINVVKKAPYLDGYICVTQQTMGLFILEVTGKWACITYISFLLYWLRPFLFFWKKCFYLSICFPCLCVGVCKERKISSEIWPEIKRAVSVKHCNFSEALMTWGLQTRLQPEVAILSFPSWALSRIKMNRGNFSCHNYNFRGLWLTLNKLVSHFQSIPQGPQWGFFDEPEWDLDVLLHLPELKI